MMIYWMVSTVWPCWSLGRSAFVTSAVSLGVELLKLYHVPALDAFRLTVPGKLLLGRVFSSWDLLAYTVAVVMGVLADRAMRRR